MASSWTNVALAIAGIAGGAALLFSDRSEAASGGKRAPTGPRRELAAKYLRLAEQLTKIEGLETFGLAAALGESAWNPGAHNGSVGERSAAQRLFAGALGRGYFADSEYLDSDAWGSGSWGWFGLLPATALAGRGLGEVDPSILTKGDHPESLALQVAAFVDLLYRLSRYEGVQAWGDLRAGMASLKAMFGGGARSKAALAEDLAAIDAPAGFIDRVPGFSGYVQGYSDAADLYVAIFEGMAGP